MQRSFDLKTFTSERLAALRMTKQVRGRGQECPRHNATPQCANVTFSPVVKVRSFFFFPNGGLVT
jgi:hypothetical protein